MKEFFTTLEYSKVFSYKGGQIRFVNNLKAMNINSEFGRVQFGVNMNPGVYPYVVQYELHDAGKKIKAGEVTLVR